MFAIGKNSACNRMHCEPAARGAPLRRYPLYCARQEKAEKREWPTIACAVRTDRTWQAAAQCQRSYRQIRGIKKQRNESATGANHYHPAPDALDELRDAVHSVAVVRQKDGSPGFNTKQDGLRSLLIDAAKAQRAALRAIGQHKAADQFAKRAGAALGVRID